MNVNRSRRRAATLAITGIACMGAVLASPGIAAAEGVSDAEKSIVLVGIDWAGYVEFPDADGVMTWSDPVSFSAMCTGWFASSQGHIVTAGHCVDPEEGKTALIRQFLADNDALELESVARSTWRVEGQNEGAPPERTVQVVQPPSVEGAVVTTPLTVQVADFQPFDDGDVALLKANGLSEETPALSIAEQPADIGDPITAIGFPGSVADVSDVTRLRASFKSGTVSSTQVNTNGVAGTEVNADISAGMSGGPTIDENGGVLGTNSYTINGEEQAFNFITDARALRSYLERQDVPLAAPSKAAAPSTASDKNVVSAEPADSKGMPVWAYAAGGGLLLVVVLTLVLVLVRRRPSTGPVPMPTAGPAPVPSAGPAPVPGPFGPAPVSAPLIPIARESMEPAGGMHRSPAAGPACSHEGNAPGARFCQNCGGPLVPAPANNGFNGTTP